jgi:hypothetical protein
MESIWMGIAPGLFTTRVVAMAGPNETLLKAQLARDPRHARALPTLLEAEGSPHIFERIRYSSGNFASAVRVERA